MRSSCLQHRSIIALQLIHACTAHRKCEGCNSNAHSSQPRRRIHGHGGSSPGAGAPLAWRGSIRCWCSHHQSHAGKHDQLGTGLIRNELLAGEVVFKGTPRGAACEGRKDQAHEEGDHISRFSHVRPGRAAATPTPLKTDRLRSMPFFTLVPGDPDACEASDVTALPTRHVKRPRQRDVSLAPSLPLTVISPTFNIQHAL